MDGLGGPHAETTQRQKDKYCMISLTCGIFKIKLVNETRKETDSQI